jgi:glycosyltransferase involved in cell wall biosynthesis
LKKTLWDVKQTGARIYNYYPDVSITAHDRYILEALPAYDHVFTTKSYQVKDLEELLGVSRVTFIPHGYCPDVHQPLLLNEWDKKSYETEVSFIGIHSPKKERLIASVRGALPHVKIRVFGNLWRTRCSTPGLYPFIMGRPVMGWAYSKAIQAAKVNLGINSETVKGSSSGDLTSTRSFEIPACGGFMIHERNHEIQSFYEEDKEIVLFDDENELVEKIQYYLNNPDLRKAISMAGHRRCVPAYSYDERMRECLCLHERIVTKHYDVNPLGTTEVEKIRNLFSI